MAKMERRPRPARRPRRMGQCSEVADGGENLEDHPALANRYVSRTAPFQRANGPAKCVPGTLNLSHSIQTKPCLGHCITRGIGLRRQATIFRLRGAVLFSGNSDARAGLERIPRAAICQQMENGNFVVPHPLWECVALRVDRELTHATHRPTS
jgi:hypothetical protein